MNSSGGKRILTGLTIAALAGVAAATFAFTAPEPAAPLERSQAPAPGLSAEPIAADQPSAVDYRRLDQRISALMQEPDMVGLAVGTVERGQVRFVRGYGETMAGSGNPITSDTVFRWASLSKGIASALVTQLAEDRRLALDAPMASMGTSLTLPGGTTTVTVADLLSHRVGLVRNAWDDRLEGGADPRQLRAALSTLPAFCPPATCYGYQNVAFDAATEIVEKTSGDGYARVARDRLFAPLGMTSATVDRAGLESAQSWARPHRRQGIATRVNDNYYRVPAAGGVNSSIRDLTRWMRAQMGDAPDVLSATALGTMHQRRVPTPPNGRRGAMDRALTDAAYGLGWRVYTYAGRTLVGHRGSVDGYGALILFDPGDKSGIVMLWNSNTPKPARLQLEFFDMLYALPPTDWLELPPPLTPVDRSGG